MPSGEGKTAMGIVFKRYHALDENLNRVEVSRIGERKEPVVLRKGIDHGIEFLLFFALVFPIGISGETEGIFRFVPVVDLDAFVGGERKDLLHGLVSGLPAEAAGHEVIAFTQREFFLFSTRIHDTVPYL